MDPSTQTASVATSLATAVQVVDAPTQTNGVSGCGAVRADESGGGGGCGSVHTDGVSGCGAVELTSMATVAAVDAQTEAPSVDVVRSS